MKFFLIIVISCLNVDLFPVAFPVKTNLLNDTLPTPGGNISIIEKLEATAISSDSMETTAISSPSMETTVLPRDYNIDSDVTWNKTETTVVLEEEKEEGTTLEDPNTSGKQIVTSCVSQATSEYINNPCSRHVEEQRSRSCNINDIFHLMQETKDLLQVLKSELASEYDSGFPDLHLYTLDKTTHPDSRLEELEKSLQVYFLYISEANSIYSTLELSGGKFTPLRRRLLSVLCSLDSGTPSVPPSITACLSNDLIIFFPQTIHILKSLHADLQVAMTWKDCQSS